jgi:predicted nucleic acid-binding protein
MRRYLLDTGPLAALLLNRPAAITTLDPRLAHGELATNILAYGEVIEYLKSFPQDYDALRSGLLDLLEAVHPYVLTYRIMERYADLRRAMRAPYGQGLIGDIDTLIAATALQYDLTVVTLNTRHFNLQRVPGLTVEVIDLRS